MRANVKVRQRGRVAQRRALCLVRTCEAMNTAGKHL